MLLLERGATIFSGLVTKAFFFIGLVAGRLHLGRSRLLLLRLLLLLLLWQTLLLWLALLLLLLLLLLLVLLLLLLLLFLLLLLLLLNSLQKWVISLGSTSEEIVGFTRTEPRLCKRTPHATTTTP